ncbi:MAG: glycosyltransferase family 25 protein [bacterium]|nr:glycosyltransferase family 25 protein [bacterium]
MSARDMRIVVVSLRHARERRERITQQFSEINLPFEFMDAIDARDLTTEDMAQVDTRYRRRWGLRPLAPSELACWRSHVHAIGQASTGPDPMIAIFEDDAILRPELPAVLSALENCPVPFDIVSLGRRQPQRPLVAGRPLAEGRSMGRIRYTEYGAYGYVVKKECALHLMNRMSRMRLPVDMELLFFWVHQLNLYFLDVPVVEHDDDIPSQLTADRASVLAGWKTPRLRQIGYRLQMGVRKRIGFRRLV